LGESGEAAKFAAVVGPPGAGKTAVLAKLAVQYGLRNRKPVQFLSMDTLRVGAAEQLRSYAAILGVGFQIADTNRALSQALEEHRGKGLVLIDTPGFAISDLEAGNETADFLARRTDIQKHLVLPASMRLADMRRTSAAYDSFRPSRLIFTRLDETQAFGPALSLASGGERPVSFLSNGQRVPENLEPASKAALTHLLLPISPHFAVSAA
jgi:flagellar biosynthesis protein FlhF